MVHKVFIHVGTGEKFPILLNVKRFQRTTVLRLKKTIQDRKRIPVIQQQLWFRYRPLDDNSLLLNAGVKDGSIIDLTVFASLSSQYNCTLCKKNEKKSMSITIRTYKGKTFTIDLCDESFQSTTVLQLKRINIVDRIKADKKRLILSGQQLEDDRLLSDCGVKDKSVIYLFLWDAVVNPSNKDDGMSHKRKENQSEHDRTLPCIPHEGKSAEEATDQHHKVQKVLVQTMMGKKLIDFSNRQLKGITVLHLKEEIQVLQGIKVYQQRLIFNSQTLEDDDLLSAYGVKDESVIFLRLKRPDEYGRTLSYNHYQEKCSGGATDGRHTMVVKVYVKSLCGKTISINLPIRHFLSIKVLHLKWKIESLEGIPADQQRIIFGGLQLEDNRPLSDYGVIEETVIHLVLRLRGGDPRLVIVKKRKKRRSRSMERLSDF